MCVFLVLIQCDFGDLFDSQVSTPAPSSGEETEEPSKSLNHYVYSVFEVTSMHYYTTTKKSHTELGLPAQKLYLGVLPKAVCLATCVAVKFQDSLLKKCLCIMAK